MITRKDIQVEDDTFLISLSKLIGKPIKDIHGHLSDEYGGVTFVLYSIVFEDGTSMSVEGEHDFPYLVQWRTQPQPNFDDETLERLLAEENADE